MHIALKGPPDADYGVILHHLNKIDRIQQL